MAASQEDAGRVVRRPPPVQAAALVLVVCGIAALNLYRNPAPPVRALTLLLGAALLVSAWASLRMYLVADREGVAVRFLRRETWLPWSEVDRVEVVSRVRGAYTIRISRPDSTHVDVPPSLLQPVRPTRAPVAIARLKELARQLDDLRLGR